MNELGYEPLKEIVIHIGEKGDCTENVKSIEKVLLQAFC